MKHAVKLEHCWVLLASLLLQLIFLCLLLVAFGPDVMVAGWTARSAPGYLRVHFRHFCSVLWTDVVRGVSGAATDTTASVGFLVPSQILQQVWDFHLFSSAVSFDSWFSQANQVQRNWSEGTETVSPPLLWICHRNHTTTHKFRVTFLNRNFLSSPHPPLFGYAVIIILFYFIFNPRSLCVGVGKSKARV